MATDYGTRLRQAREHAKLTQVGLSKKTGIPQTTISTAERLGHGSSETSIYARACGVDAHWLATGEGEMVLRSEVFTTLGQEIAAILQDDEPQNRAERLKEAERRWSPEYPEAPSNINERIRPALTTESHLFELSKLLSQLDDDNKAVAAVILSNWAKKPESYAAVAKHLDLMCDSGNNPAQQERQPKSINSGGR